MSSNQAIKLNPAIFNEQLSSYFDPAYWQSQNAITGKEKGRGTTWFIQHKEHELVLRHFYRGGFVRHFNRDSYLFTKFANTRSFREYKILETLFAKGLPVPEPAGANVVRNGLFYKADLITRRIADANDLSKVLQSPASTKLIDKIAETIAQLHDAGVQHPDLNIQNILVDHAEKVWVIDFDQAFITTLEQDDRAAMVARLKRSFEKEIERHGIVWTPKNWQQFEDSYNAYSHQ